ncbi:MAG: cytochrome c [Chloroflexi bacterium]|nr:cytochrome c [Chloroflexota bacterium]
MQVKVAIGTIAFMLTMIVLGYAALREPTRLEEFTDAAQGRSIETGGKLFDANCATCHGVKGEAEECYDAGSGEAIPCVGLPLNSYFLVCGDRPKRLDDLGWDGSKVQYIQRTISAGRSGTQMPPWLDEFGGPLRPDQVENLADFVLNWGDEEMCAQEPSSFDWPDTAEDFLALDEIQAGDPAAGAEVYLNLGCNACHGMPDQEGSATVGTWLGDIAETGATRVPGQSAEDYVYESILDPNAFIAPDCPTGPCTDPSLMPGDFAFRLSTNPQDMADILSYLMGE